MHEDDCVKLVGVFTFLFLIALCSTCLIFCALSKSLAMGSCSYSCTIDYPIGDWSAANLISLIIFFSFVAINVRLADRSLILYLDICCWDSCMIKEISVLKSNWPLLPFPFMLYLTVFFILLHRRFHVFVCLSWHTFKFFVEIVKHQI